MASLSCASILCAVVLLITNGSIRHAVFVADFRGGFPWRIFVADFQWRILRRISVADFRGGFSVADFRGGFAWRILRSGFPWRICLADFAADFAFFFGGGFAADFSKSCGGFCGGFLRRICSGPKPCKLHVKIAPKIHHKNPPHSSPHARLVCDYTLPAFFTACFAACPSTGILHYLTYTADFFRGGF